MTGKLTEDVRVRATSGFGSRLRSGKLRSACLTIATWLLLGGLGLGLVQAKPKTDKFEGTVVVVGPKAITVKSIHNIYLVRTFHYSAELEQKMLRSKPEPGKKITVHYVRGSDLALKVD